MDLQSYLQQFDKAAAQFRKKIPAGKNIEVAAGEVLQSAFLKLYKRSWATPGQDALTATSRIFFSVWVNDDTLEQQKIFYNIHAFKLRALKGYSIESRRFAEMFRKDFAPFKHNWPNVSTAFGPLTLMEGWVPLNHNDLEKVVLELAHNFLEIEQLIDNSLSHFKQKKA